MEYIYAVMLLHKAGKDITEENVTAVLKAAGVDVDSAKVKSLIAALEGANIDELIEQGSVVAAAAPVSGGNAGGSAPNAQETPKEEKKEEPKTDVNAAAGLGSLF